MTGIHDNDGNYSKYSIFVIQLPGVILLMYFHVQLCYCSCYVDFDINVAKFVFAIVL